MVNKAKGHENISIKSIDINGIRGKKLEVQSYLVSNKPDVIAIQETKIDIPVTNSELFSDQLGSDIFRNLCISKGGGIMLLIKKTLNPAPVSLTNSNTESVYSKMS